MREDQSLTFPSRSTARYSFIQLSDWGVVERTNMHKLQNGSKADLDPGSLESSILSLNFHATSTKTRTYCGKSVIGSNIHDIEV